MTEPLPIDFQHPRPTVVSAHERCREVEATIMRKLNETSIESVAVVLRKELVNVRILGHLLTVGPSDFAKAHIAKTIISCEDDQTLIAQGGFYDQYFIRTCKLPFVAT